MRIGSHGLTHVMLTNLKETQIQDELEGSKRNLEINLNRSIKDFSIPRGFYNDKVIDKAYQAGYERVFVSVKLPQGKADCLARIAIKHNWSLKQFKENMSGHLSWSEAFNNHLKSWAKALLKEPGYCWFRNQMIRVIS